MTLRIRTIILIGLIFLMAAVFFAVNFKKIILESFIRLEKQDMIIDLNRAISFLDSKIEALNLINSDWSGWDYTYEFINEINPEYIKSNLVNGTFVNLGLNLMVFLNASGEIVYGNGFDLVREEKTPIPEGFVEYVEENPSLVKFSDTGDSIKGILMLPRHVMMVSSRPILTSEDKGPIRGTLVMGRHLDKKEIDQYARILHLKVSLVDVRGLPEIAHVIQDTNEFVVRTSDNDAVIGYGLIRDVFNAPAVAIKIVKNRDVYGIGIAALKNIGAWMTAFGVFFFIVLIVLLDKLVLTRIRNLKADVNRIINTGDISGRVTVKGKDELAGFARSINEMLTTIEKSQFLLQESEEKYRKLFETSPEVVFTISTADRKITSLNSAFESVTQWSIKEWVGRPFFELLLPEDIPAAEKQYNLTLEGKATGPFESRIISKNGDILTGEFMATPEIKDGQMTSIIGFARDITSRKEIENELKKTALKLKNLSNQLINFQEMERQRIADELHDQLGQDMTVLKFGIRNVMKQIPGDDHLKIRQSIEEILPLIDMIIENIRSLARDLSPLILREFGLKTALNRLVENFTRLGGYECTVDIAEIDEVIPVEKHILLYRIIQELLTNIAKHANASRLVVKALRENNHVRISVSDNGNGFDVDAVLQPEIRHAGNGIGLTIVEQRVDLIGGTVEIQSSRDRGTTTIITIPIEKTGDV